MTIRSARIPFAGEYGNRLGSTSKDRRYKNVLFDVIRGEDGPLVYAVKRPGMSQHSSVTAGAGRGCYQWKGSLYSVVGNTVYKDGVSVGTVTNTTGLCYFTEEHKTDLLVIQDGSKIIKITAADVLTELTDAQIPTSQVPGIVSLDTYVLVMNEDGEIYNSDLDDVSNWTSGNFITAKLEPDDGVALFKHKNYAAALGQWSLEFFYDAANESGSPLDPVEGVSQYIGCASGDSLYVDAGETEDMAIWVSRTRNSGPRVTMMSNLQLESLSNSQIERILNQEETSLDSCLAFGMRISGHLLYLLTLTSTGITLVCDVTASKLAGFPLWSEWTFDPGTESYFTGISHAEMDGRHYIQDEDNGKVYMMDFDIYQDDGNDINVELVTGIWDGGQYGSMRTKHLHRATILGDEQASTSNVTFQWTVDDYQNWSTARTIDMSKTFPSAYQMGSAERVAFRLQHAANTPFRSHGLELGYSLGGYKGGNY